MAEKVHKHTGKTSLFEDSGVDEDPLDVVAAVDLPSGG